MGHLPHNGAMYIYIYEYEAKFGPSAELYDMEVDAETTTK